MTIELKKVWEFFDASEKSRRKERVVKVEVLAGIHEIEIVSPNPWYSQAEDPCIIVLKGTLIGLGKQYLESFVGAEHGVRQVIIRN